MIRLKTRSSQYNGISLLDYYAVCYTPRVVAGPCKLNSRRTVVNWRNVYSLSIPTGISANPTIIIVFGPNYTGYTVTAIFVSYIPSCTRAHSIRIYIPKRIYVIKGPEGIKVTHATSVVRSRVYLIRPTQVLRRDRYWTYSICLSDTEFDKRWFAYAYQTTIRNYIDTYIYVYVYVQYVYTHRYLHDVQRVHV